MSKEVIILGCGPTRVECKYHCETWGVNGTYEFAKRLDKLFMTDEVSEVEASIYNFQKIRKLNPTLVFPIAYPKFSKNGFKIELYPIEPILQRFQTRFFSNSIAYMLAYALLYDYTKIWFYGIDMMTYTTYAQEKGGVEFWMGVALGVSTERRARGLEPIEVINTKGSATGKTWDGKMYGYWGQLQEERLKERLFAPPEMIRVSKASAPQTEWIMVGGEYMKVETQVNAGEEIAQ